MEYPRVYPRDDQARLLDTAGFGTVVFYGTYDFAAYDPESSRRLIAVARR